MTTPSKRIERNGLTKYALRVTVGDDGVRFTVTSADGRKQHANATLAPQDAVTVARFILGGAA